jgi:hypothetical protein
MFRPVIKWTKEELKTMKTYDAIEKKIELLNDISISCPVCGNHIFLINKEVIECYECSAKFKCELKVKRIFGVWHEKSE